MVMGLTDHTVFYIIQFRIISAIWFPMKITKNGHQNIFGVNSISLMKWGWLSSSNTSIFPARISTRPLPLVTAYTPNTLTAPKSTKFPTQTLFTPSTTRLSTSTIATNKTALGSLIYVRNQAAFISHRPPPRYNLNLRDRACPRNIAFSGREHGELREVDFFVAEHGAFVCRHQLAVELDV